MKIPDTFTYQGEFPTISKIAGNICLDQEEMLKMAWYSMHISFGCANSNGTSFEAVYSDISVMDHMYALSWKLLIIGLLSEYFTTLLKMLHLKKMTTKCSIFLHQLYFFLMGRSRTFLVMIKFHLGGQEEGVRRRYGGEGHHEVFFLQIPVMIFLYKLYHKLLVRQTSSHHHCDWHTQKPVCRDFQVILSSSSWSKTTLCIFKEHIWLPNRKCYGKK